MTSEPAVQRNRLAFCVLVSSALACMAHATAAEPIALALPTFPPDSQIAGNIRSECDMAQQLSQDIVKAGKRRGLDIEIVPAHQGASSARALSIEFTDAMSRRSGGPGGHNKFVAVSGELVLSEGASTSFTARRRSSGGAGGWMKSACTVFGRINRTLADDIAEWLGNPVNGAQLGDLR